MHHASCTIFCDVVRRKDAFPAIRPAGSDLVTLVKIPFWQASFLRDKFIGLCKPTM